MMNTSPVALLAVVLGAFSAVVAVATTLMVLWQGSGRLVNRLVAIYSFAVFVWASSVFGGYLEILHGRVIVLPFQTVGVSAGFAAVALLALAICVAERWKHRWAQILLGVSLLLEITIAIQVYRGRVVQDLQYVNDRLAYTLNPRGTALLVLGMLVSPVALVILYRARTRVPRDVLVGSALTTSAILCRVIPVIARYPVSIPLVSVASVLFARAVLHAQLFAPAAEANRRLAALAKEVKTSEARLSAVLRNTTDAIWSIDTNYRIESMNPAAHRLFAGTYGAAMRTGSDALDLGSKERRDEWQAVYDQAIRGDRSAFERSFQVGTSKLEFEVALSPIMDGEGFIKGASAFARDITERKRSEASLRRAKKAAEDANRAKSSFLATMSHELRTPLNAIIGYSELLEETAQDAGGRVELSDIGRIKEAGRHLLNVISDILDLSKIEADKMDLRAEALDVRTLVDDVAKMARPLVEKNGNALVVAVEGEPGTVFADATRARQVLLNLLSNAAKFTEKGTITLRAYRVVPADGELDDAASIRFEIVDTGIGIKPEKLGLLFQPFSQVDPSTTRRHGGTGLGLALSRRFCILMNGDITVESEAGKGSRFTVRLPADAPPDRASSIPPETTSLLPPQVGTIVRSTPVPERASAPSPDRPNRVP